MAKLKEDKLDVIFESVKDAEQILEYMLDMIDSYGVISVYDLLDRLDLPNASSNVLSGWTDLSTAKVVGCKCGYKIDLPDEEKLEGGSEK
jgi:hypothetical protein